ncbi:MULTISPECIES: HPr family phosphocarrier protein [Idiomarinaceae]|uniref:HPr family phosphocarrier protein n=2 Tax=Pseudidiomarina TaxID=2800384 RepID=A0AB39X7U5_9GAMM|nr:MULTISPECIES: HPr family phosphocarrier protein [Idiomarinaceae]MDX1526613.1 HPr family phosphocarrier protein [Pseudidiomarina maritima]MDT7525897.1 HPr family phosphocarrier protein [Pseudidiomarina sp. GXY010]MRJ42019.1 HPr family phosphocarrier protein [Idiomarina sp. FeN1]NCU57302.1 HPr family phosphocarrier protein [Idiomarina sp. FenA--70]NCU60010.1 HPr family phosphocarrier protein [Idiomarina sp. FenBw--71]
MPTCVRKSVTIRNKLGLHARAATKLAKLTQQFAAKVYIVQEQQQVDASSVMCLLLLASGQGRQIDILAEGDDAEAAVAAVAELIESRFDEEQ